MDGNICLIGREARQWVPELGLARLLAEKLEQALTGSGDEDPQAEPGEVWWNSLGLNNSFVLVDSGWDLAGQTGGKLKLRYSVGSGAEPEFRAVVEEVLDESGASLVAWTGMIPPDLRDGKVLSIPWARYGEPLVPSPGLSELGALITGETLFKRPLGRMLAPKLCGEIYGILYPSELSFGCRGDAWLFPLLVGPPKAFGPKAKGQVKLRTVPTLRAGAADVGARVPAVQHLRNKCIAVVGMGALGAPAAVELARNGCGELRLLDFDRVEPGNSIRWPLGTSAWGRLKVEALQQFISTQYSWTSVVSISHRIGDVGSPEGDEAHLLNLVDGADLVLDCAANFGVTTSLDDICRARNVPLISVWATPPVTGGGVVLFRSGSGCPTCLEHHHHTGSIARPPGLGEESGLHQPPACAERTFAGSSTDLQELALEAVRMCVQLTGENPPTSSVLETLALADAAGNRVPPSWRVEPLPVHDDCSWHH
jgi:hypothetical protein